MTSPDPLAAAAMVAYCGWDPTAIVSDVTIAGDGNGTRLLTLPSLYVTDVSAVSIVDCDGDVVTQDAADVGWSENGKLEWQSWGVWPEGSRNILVTYSGGYDSIPDDLSAALAHLSGRLAGMGATSRRMGTGSVSFGAAIADGGLLLVEQMVFDRYKIPRGTTTAWSTSTTQNVFTGLEVVLDGGTP